jgi:glutathione S-transferase
VRPFAASETRLSAYFDRLSERRSFQRVIDDARPYFVHFPLRDALAPRFLQAEG